MSNVYGFENLSKMKNDEMLQIGTTDFQISRDGILGFSRGAKNVQKLSLGFMTISKKLINEADVLEFIISFEFEGKIKELKVSSEDLLPNKISQLATKGVPINHEHTKALSNALVALSQELKAIPIQNKIGFYETEDGFGFNGVGNEINLSSDIAKMFDISQKGKLENEILTIKELSVTDCHIPLQLLYCLTLSALTIKINQIKLGLDVFMPFYYLLNDSSLGKTTGLMAAISPFGNPDLKSTKSFIQPFSSTDNAIMSYASKMNGYCLGIDDFGSSLSKEKTELVYSITNAKSKSRGTSDGSVIVGDSFSCCVLGTGKISMADKLTSSGGAQLRCIEFQGLAFTKNSDHAEQIKRRSNLNYGHISTEFAEKLLEMPEDKVESAYKMSFNSDEIKLLENSSAKVGRYVKQLRCVSQTVYLLNEVFDIGFDIPAIEELLVTNLEEAVVRLDYTKISYNKFDNWVHSHINYFGIEQEKSRNTGVQYGTIRIENQEDRYVCLTKENLKLVLDELSLPEEKLS